MTNNKTYLEIQIKGTIQRIEDYIKTESFDRHSPGIKKDVGQELLSQVENLKQLLNL